MTEAQKTATRSDELNLFANEVYRVLEGAEQAGFRAVVTDGWKLDLLDPETGERTPVWGLLAGESA